MAAMMVNAIFNRSAHSFPRGTSNYDKNSARAELDRQKKRRKYIKHPNHESFQFGEITIQALNFKNAKRKYINQLCDVIMSEPELMTENPIHEFSIAAKIKQVGHESHYIDEALIKLEKQNMIKKVDNKWRIV